MQPSTKRRKTMSAGSSTMDWQTGLAKIHQRAGHILQSGHWSDCSFVVGNENSQKTLKAHRLILAMSSPVFEAMFYGGMAEKGDKPVRILDVQPEAFKALLQYIYSDEINLSSFDQVCEICYAAKKYMIPALVEQCTQYIWSDLHPGNVCRALEFARLFEEPRLLDKCMQIICSKTPEVLADSSFEDVDIGTIRTIMKQENVAASELSLWEGCLRWSKQECRRQSMDVTSTNQRQVLADCLGLIRFLTLSPTEFANGPAVSGILVQEESYTLLMNISSPGVTPIPSPFSQSLKKRMKAPSPPPQASASPDFRNVNLGQFRCVCVGNILADILVNENIVDYSLTFSVDGRVDIYGVELPTQCTPHGKDQQQFPSPGSQAYYNEVIYAFLQDSDGFRITYTHFTTRVPYSSSMEVMFNSRVCVVPNKTYKIGVVLNKIGRYPLYVSTPHTKAGDLTFTFDQVRARDYLITALIYGRGTPVGVNTSQLPWDQMY